MVAERRARAARGVDEETGERLRFCSRILPAYARRSPKVTDVLPVLYLRGLSTGDFAPALRELLGEDASGLSASSISRLNTQWEADHAAFRQRSLRFHRYCYLFVDGVHMSVRLGEDDRLCLLVAIGVRRGRREGAARCRGRLPRVDRLLGRGVPRPQGPRPQRAQARDRRRRAWRLAALRDVFPEAREQRCWVHKIANVLDTLPKRLKPRAKTLLHEMMEAPTRKDAGQALDRFRGEFDAKYPKAVKLDKDRTAVTAVYHFPAEHWRHLRTTNPIESSFATGKLRTRVTKGAGSKKAALAMAYKLLDAASERWRRFNGHELVADVLAGAKFKDGTRVTEDDNHDDEMTDERVAA